MWYLRRVSDDGEHISDPEGMENGGTMKGMGLLPVTTRLKREKVRRQVHGTVNKMEGFFPYFQDWSLMDMRYMWG